MNRNRNQAMTAVARASGELQDALAHLNKLAGDHDERISYSVHALNNYLMVISTTVRLLEKRLMPLEDREVKKLLADLKHVNNTMMSTVRGVLTSNASGLPPLIFSEVSFGHIIDGACDAYDRDARAKRISLGWNRRRRAADAAADVVVTDRVAAGAVLDNLISNAVKFTPPGEAINVTVVRSAGELVCSVWDRGPGLSEEDQAHLFERGRTLTPRPTGGEPSTGFGLAIAKDLSVALGGKLTCESRLGQGTCFAFALPAKEGALSGSQPGT